MKVEKTATETTYDILDMTEKEFVALKALVNMSRVKSDKKMEGESSVWEDYMELEEVQELAQKVGNIIWGLMVEGDYQCSTGSPIK